MPARGLAAAVGLSCWSFSLALAAHPAALHEPAPPTAWGVLWSYVGLGFGHVLPGGLDHVLFVLGLSLGSQTRRALVLQLSSFTLAHSLTLALSALGLVALPTSIVEPLIALSIVYVAVENLLGARTTQRTWVALGFGLLHGLGFADAMRELGLPESHFLLALGAFNLGVELAQLAVVASAWLLVCWCVSKSWYTRRVVLPASTAVALLGGSWLVARLLQVA